MKMKGKREKEKRMKKREEDAEKIGRRGVWRDGE